MNLTRNLAILLPVVFFGFSSITSHARSCRLVFPERPGGGPKSSYLFDGEKSRPVFLPSMNLSEVVSLPKGELTLVMTMDEITDPATLPPGAPRLKIPENVIDFYIILTPDPQNTVVPVKMNLVNAGEGQLKPGHTLWHNLTAHRIAARLGTAEITVEPVGKTISKPPAPASGYYAARFAFQEQGVGEFAPITEQSWWHDSKSRHIGFIVDSGGRLPNIYYFRDFRDPEAEETTDGVPPPP